MFFSLNQSNSTQSRSAAQRPAGEEASSLIGRYPALSEVELARLINLYRSLPALDVALMLSDNELGPKIDRFFNDHRSKVRVPFRQYAVLAAIAVVGTAFFAWAAAFGA